MKYEMPARIRFSEVDQHGKLTLFHLINYFQDASTFHGEDVGRGTAWTSERGVAWVVAGWQLHIRRFPLMSEKVVVRTWPYSFRGFIGARNYTMETEDGELLAAADSEWVLMDMNKNIPTRVEKGLLEVFGSEEKFQDDFGARKIAMEGTGEEQEHFTIQEYQLDTNHHVNNGQYICMAEKYLEEGFVPVHFRAEYKKQAYLGDEIVPKVCKVEGGVQIALENTEGEAYFTAEFLNH
ncbi:MAG: thioesterase [Lachnospiraceae bacterium]|nr:thioesterase [Lachnospiraceae bacterium]